MLNKRMVAFTGTPCQVAGLRQFLGREYGNLIAIDIVCRSIPSPLFWKRYLQYQEKQYGSKIKKVNCRNKTYGYHNGTLIIRFENGKIYSGSNRVDPYMKSFHKNVCSRPSCYDCRFKTKTRCSDFTVFDCWNPQAVCDGEIQDNNCGYSNVIIHTDRGNEIFGKLHNIDIHRACIERMFLYTGGMESQSIEWVDGRESFYENLQKMGVLHAVKKVVSITKADVMIEKAKPIVFKVKNSMMNK